MVSSGLSGTVGVVASTICLGSGWEEARPKESSLSSIAERQDLGTGGGKQRGVMRTVDLDLADESDDGEAGLAVLTVASPLLAGSAGCGIDVRLLQLLEVVWFPCSGGRGPAEVGGLPELVREARPLHGPADAIQVKPQGFRLPGSAAGRRW